MAEPPVANPTNAGDPRSPTWSAQLLRQAIGHHAAGRLREAEADYRQVLREDPAHAGAAHGLGVLAFQTGRLAEALQLIGQAVQRQGDSAEYWNNFGLVLRQARRPADAVEAHRRAIRLNPSDPAGFTLLGLALRDGGAFADAEDACRTAVALRPGEAYLHNNLGTVLMRARRLDEAAAVFRRALELQGGYVKAINNLGTTLLWAGQPEQALVEYDRALRLQPSYAEVHWHRAVALLTMGDWARGWAEYEWRWGCGEYQPFAYRLARPLWDGSKIAGKTILVTPEQGLGDSIQFARYVPMLAAAGAKVLLLCQPELARLMASVPGAAQVLAAEPMGVGPANRPLPPALRDLPFDAYIPLLSLPLRFGTTVATVPAPVPYLRPEPQKQEQWRQRLLQAEAQSDGSRVDTGNAAAPEEDDPARPARPDRPVRRIGLVWAGRPIPDPARTCGLDVLAPLAAVADAAGIRLYSLQTGPASADVHRAPPGMHVTDFSADLRDFADTAALMANLDLVITIDTAAAHLAGALGRPTWTLLRDVADWRWLTGREDTPWYPTMRLFRQTRPGDWPSVVARVSAELQRLAQPRAGRAGGGV